MKDVDLVKKWEALRLVAYLDTGGVWTIGYGHTGPDVHKGFRITEVEALRLLDEDMKEARDAVAAYISVPITQAQQAVLVSFAFNVGSNALKTSTLRKRVNAKDWQGAADQLLRWVHDNGKVVQGLVNRRREERKLFLSELPTAEKPKEKVMLSEILMPLLKAISGNLPELARTLALPNVVEQNVEALSKVADIIVQATESPNLQAAAEKIKMDIAVADVVDETLRMSRADIMDSIERTNKMEQANIASAREYNKSEDVIFGNIKFVHLLSAFLIVFSGIGGVLVLLGDFSAELKGSVVTLILIGGWTGVQNYWLGSSSSSRLKDVSINKALDK